MSSTDSESLTFANVKTPTTMPASEKARIQNLKCPPPLKPSQANAQIRTLNQSIQAQQTQIEILEKIISDLEKRYKITFTCDNAPTFISSIDGSTVRPIVDLSGSVTNPNISIQMISGAKGLQGIPGKQGVQGPSGKAGIPGIQGQPGYYGMRGDVKK
jgi:hypothetical protein